jgi:sulfur carrier protein ThiS
VEVTRAGRTTRHELSVTSGTLVRSVLREIGQRAEGSAALVDDTPIPLDTPISAPIRLVVVPTFSGG